MTPPAADNGLAQAQLDAERARRALSIQWYEASVAGGRMAKTVLVVAAGAVLVGAALATVLVLRGGRGGGSLPASRLAGDVARVAFRLVLRVAERRLERAL
jgi:hypothetical protein